MRHQRPRLTSLKPKLLAQHVALMDHGLTTEVPTVETTGQDGAGTTAMEETTAAAAITVDVDAVTTMAIATITGGESDFL